VPARETIIITILIFAMAQKASDMESLQGYIVSASFGEAFGTSFVGHNFDTFTNKTEQIQMGHFTSF
jgi:hypothetical protein